MFYCIDMVSLNLVSVASVTLVQLSGIP